MESYDLEPMGSMATTCRDVIGMSISRFDDLEGRIYHEVLLDHQREDDGGCICGWKVYVKGIYTHRMHLAIVIKDWLEANFILVDKV